MHRQVYKSWLAAATRCVRHISGNETQSTRPLNQQHNRASPATLEALASALAIASLQEHMQGYDLSALSAMCHRLMPRQLRQRWMGGTTTPNR
jgi:hypothetical protein